MPISMNYLFYCEKCNYKKIYLIGDNRLPLDMIKKCPKCNTIMKYELCEDDCKQKDIFTKITDRLKKIFS